MPNDKKHVFLVCGYGVPKDIFKDDNTRLYLHAVFNRVYDETVRGKMPDPVLVFSGGRTDMWKPYRRTEAGEMARYVRSLMNRPFLKKAVRMWKVLPETQAISTVENLTATRDLLRKKGLDMGMLTIFCERTREARVRALARLAFPGVRTRVIAVDFDVSANRYLDPAFLRKKEDAALRLERRALKDPAFAKRLHGLFGEKLRFLRQRGGGGDVEAVRDWWQKSLAELEKMT